MHRFFAPQTNDGDRTATLPDDESHHLTRVLRLGAGADVLVFDGRGHEWLGRVASASSRGAVIDLVASRRPVVEPSVHVTLAVGLLKGHGMDSIVRDATTLGTAVIAPFVSAHVALPDEARRRRSLERWTRVAVASAKQCGRAVVPAMRPVTTFDRVLAAPADLRVVCVEPAHGGGASVRDLPRPERALVCVGPEGGWSADELDLARQLGATCIDLGPRTLRAEVAPTVALAALWTAWGW